MSVRLPLQLGRAALNQGARFAATVWWFPFLLLLSAMLFDGLMGIIALPIGLAAFFALAFAVDAAGTAKRDRPADIVLDETGFVIEGGPLDKTRCTWAEVDAAHCDIIEEPEPRIAVRWLILSWLTLKRVLSILKRVRVPVEHLQLPRKKKGDKLVLAEAEGSEHASLVQLRDSIRGAAKPATDDKPAKLPQEILTCPHCDAPQVPAATPTMTCPYCRTELDVPEELRDRVRASVELEGSSESRARAVRKLVDQPSARRAGLVIAWCRRLMVWIQPAVFIFFWVLASHQTSHVIAADGIEVVRVAPSDDGVVLYDLALLGLAVASAFGIAWSVGHAYVANRQALRVLADHFGAIPPVKPGAPSSCRQCGAPLPVSTKLLVHCVYCSAENVIGIDPRPAALRRAGEHMDLQRGLRSRRRARMRLAIVTPLSALLALGMTREVRRVWDVPEHVAQGGSCTYGRCGTITNEGWIQHTVVISGGDQRVMATVVPRGAIEFSCVQEACTVELGASRIAVKSPTELRIEYGTLRHR
ncbi:MAG TPA: hypothetical protein VIV58_13555 [Kofleriaceae bacterium]